MKNTTIEQKRAIYAFEAVQGLKGNQLESYRAAIKGFPATVLTNGLGQALALLLANDETILYGHLEAWLCKEAPHPPYHIESGKFPLMEALMKGSQDQYVVAQAEVHALVGWLKKFTSAMAASNHS